MPREVKGESEVDGEAAQRPRERVEARWREPAAAPAPQGSAIAWARDLIASSYQSQ